MLKKIAWFFGLKPIATGGLPASEKAEGPATDPEAARIAFLAATLSLSIYHDEHCAPWEIIRHFTTIDDGTTRKTFCVEISRQA